MLALVIVGLSYSHQKGTPVGFEYLGLGFAAMNAQARVAADEKWIKQFPPQQLAVLHGVIADKLIRIIEASHVEPLPSADAEDYDEEDDAD